jgi:hypothetical protein
MGNARVFDGGTPLVTVRPRCILPGIAAAVLWASAAAAQMGPPSPGPRCLPGLYDGDQAELAAQLQLGADHRFRYALSYGALDEAAEGSWESDGARNVLLTSDPTTPPRFALLSENPGTPGRLRVALDLPAGISRQYFSAIIRFADGRSSVRQFQDEGLTLDLEPDDRLVSVSLLLSVLDLESEPFKLSATAGGEMQVRFEPNDLGKVAFARAPLRIDQDDLLLERHERLIRFRRSREGCETSAP